MTRPALRARPRLSPSRRRSRRNLLDRLEVIRIGAHHWMVVLEPHPDRHPKRRADDLSDTLAEILDRDRLADDRALVLRRRPLLRHTVRFRSFWCVPPQRRCRFHRWMIVAGDSTLSDDEIQ